MPTIEITDLCVYPVKSMKGIPLRESILTFAGLQHDRRWMVVSSDGRFVTQRNLPRLALVHTALRGKDVELALDGHGSILVSADDSAGKRIHTKVWSDPCETIDQGEEASRWLTSAMESREVLRLVRMASGFVRPQGKADLLGNETSTFFADAAPYLVANEASLDALNQALVSRGHAPVPMNRFRPNIVVRGTGPFTGQEISDISGLGYTLRFCHPCERCVVTTIEQDTATRHPGRQPYLTLRDINPMPGNEKAPAFAHNAILVRGEGERIAVGDSLATQAADNPEALHV